MSNDTSMLYSTVDDYIKLYSNVDDYIENLQRIFDQTHDRIQVHQKRVNDAWLKYRERLDVDECKLDTLKVERRQLTEKLKNCLGKVEMQKRQELDLAFQNMHVE